MTTPSNDVRDQMRSTTPVVATVCAHNGAFELPLPSHLSIMNTHLDCDIAHPRPPTAEALSSSAPDASSAPLHSHSPSGTGQPSLLDGFKCFLDYILTSEADYLCGTLLPARSQQRLNYRMGHYTRHIRTPIGAFPVHVPHLRYIHLRPSILKRAKRLSPIILESFARIRSNTASRAEAASLVSLVWTMNLPDELLAKLTAGLLPVLDNWRRGILVVEPPKPRKRMMSKNAVARPAAISASRALAANDAPPGYAVY